VYLSEPDLKVFPVRKYGEEKDKNSAQAKAFGCISAGEKSKHY